jgi:outer membrane immunogenic protein
MVSGMRKFLAVVGLTTGLLSGSAAWASEPDAGLYSWRGFYIGASLGGASASVDRSFVGSSFWATGPGGTGNFDQTINDAIWGGHLGYNFQSGPWVYGVDVSVSAPITHNFTSPFFPGSDRWTTEIAWLTLVTGRLGYAFDRTLIYAKGGYAGAEVEASMRDVITNVVGFCGPSQPQGPCHAGGSNWQHGWVVGGGVEFALARQLTLGVEYNYIDLGSERITNLTSATAGTVASDQTVDVTVQTVTARLSVKLN